MFRPKCPTRVLYHEFVTVMNTRDILGKEIAWHYLITNRPVIGNKNPIDFLCNLILSYKAGLISRRVLDTSRRACYKQFWNRYVRTRLWNDYNTEIAYRWRVMWSEYNKEIFKKQAYSLYKDDIEAEFIRNQKNDMEKTFKKVE